MLLTETALEESNNNIRKGGEIEKAEYLCLLDRVKIIPSAPSERALSLDLTKKVGYNDILIFGTGDRLGVTTMTSDKKFISGAEAQGVFFYHYLHRPVPLTGK